MKDVPFRFVADFDYRPLPGQTIAYLAGMELEVPERCAEEAEAAGAGERLKGGTRGADEE